MFNKFYDKFVISFVLGLLFFGGLISEASWAPAFSELKVGTIATGTNGSTQTWMDMDITWGEYSFTIMDRNLGAVSNDINNSDSYGYVYQWGNNYGFLRGALDSVSKEQVDASEFGPYNPYASKIFVKHENLMQSWDSSDNPNLRGDITNTEEARQGPCPIGYHVPSIEEWNNIVAQFKKWYSTPEGKEYCGGLTEGICFPYALLLPLRSIFQSRIIGYYWSTRANFYVEGSKTYTDGTPIPVLNTEGAEHAYGLQFEEGYLGKTTNTMLYDVEPVRCLKNSQNGYIFKSNDEFVQAYNFAYKNGITTKNTIGEANMNGNLTRIEMAKMLSNYAINILGLIPDTSKFVYFSDVSNNLNEQYDNGVINAYRLGIMGIGINTFRPYDKVTRAEFGTALSRLLYNTDNNYNKNGAYYEPHLAKLKANGIISNDDPNLIEKRGYVMLMLMRSAK